MGLLVCVNFQSETLGISLQVCFPFFPSFFSPPFSFLSSLSHPGGKLRRVCVVPVPLMTPCAAHPR